MSAVRWGLCCREGDPLRVCGPTGGVLFGRTREYLERLHQIFPDSELVEGADGRLEFWTWVDPATGQRRRRPEGALRLLPVAPVGTRTAQALIEGRITDVTEPVYPPPPVDLREIWQASGLVLRTAAGVLGLTPSELSALWQGCARPDRDSDWQSIVERLRAAGEVQP